MDIQMAIERIRNHPDAHKIGMIVSHLGIVRVTSRDGGEITGIDVKHDRKAIEAVRAKIKAMPGIVDVVVETKDGHLSVGDEIMFVVVGGDIRENVFPALMEGVDQIKRNGCSKREYFKD